MNLSAAVGSTLVDITRLLLILSNLMLLVLNWFWFHKIVVLTSDCGGGEFNR